MKRIIFILLFFISIGAKAQLRNNQPFVINLLQYGLVSDTNRTHTSVKVQNDSAFAQGLRLAIAHGGWSELDVPGGYYIVDSIVIPAIGFSQYCHITIKGEVPFVDFFGTEASAVAMPINGTVIQSYDNSSAFDAVIRQEPNSGTFSSVSVSLFNLDIRTYDNPNMNGVDMGWAEYLTMGDVFINTNTYNPNAAQPSLGTTGLITPFVNNGDNTFINYVVVTGYYNGIQANEQLNGSNIVVMSCFNGLNSVQGFHPWHLDRVSICRVKYPIYVSGQSVFTIDNLAIEDVDSATQTVANTRWQLTWAAIKDTANIGHGTIWWNSVHGAVGTDSTFVVIGGTHMHYTHIGAPPNIFAVSNNSGANNFTNFLVQSGDSTLWSFSYPCSPCTAVLSGNPETSGANSVIVLSESQVGASNNSYAGFGIFRTSGYLGSPNNNVVLASSKNGSGTQLPILIGGFNASSWTTWMQFSIAGVINIPNLTASNIVSTDGSKNLVSVAETGTGNVVMSASPTFTGVPLSTTAAAGTNTTQIATTAFVLANVLKYAHTIFAPTTGGTVALVNNQYNIINPAGSLLALTLNLPSTPTNGDVVYIKFTQTISTVTYANGTVVDGITAPTAGGLTVLTYDSGTTSWY